MDPILNTRMQGQRADQPKVFGGKIPDGYFLAKDWTEHSDILNMKKVLAGNPLAKDPRFIHKETLKSDYPLAQSVKNCTELLDVLKHVIYK